MSDIIEHTDDGVSSVQVGDGQQASVIPMKVYQDVYHQVTGRTEQIRKKYDDNLLMDGNEIQQIHHKIMQLCDVHQVVASNETISVFHEKERKEQFTSFSRFLSYNVGTASPTTNVVLKYNFSIVASGLARPQEYIVTIRLSSRVALIKQLEEDAPAFFPSHVFGMMVGCVAEIRVEYVDYVVARGFIEAFDEWVSGCNSNPENKFIKTLRRFSFLVPKMAGPLVAILALIFSLDTLGGGSLLQADYSFLIRFIMIYITGLYLLVTAANFSAKLIENSIDKHIETSYININKGDVKLVDEFGKRKKWVVLEFIGGCLLTVVLGIAATKLAALV
jgi:hypothetical protein